MAKSNNYSFGEKKTEYNAKLGKEVETFLTPKYIEAKQKAIETLESDMLKGVILESDFWILMNATKSGKMAYTGLIISHNGCLKINDVLPETKRFKPSCLTLDKDGYKNTLVYTYVNDDQGLYEVGEVSDKNCLNSYPYAMALKRCFDRVVLKNSRLAYSGIYSDSESDEFKGEPLESKPEKKKTDPDPSPDESETPAPIVNGQNIRQALVNYCRDYDIDIKDIAKKFKLNNTAPDSDFKLALDYCIDLSIKRLEGIV